MKKINVPSFPSSSFFSFFLLNFKACSLFCCKIGTICQDTGQNSILLYSACQGRRVAPWGGMSWETGLPQRRPCPQLLSHSFHAQWAETGAGNGAHDGPRLCEDVGQAFGPAGGSRPVEAGVRPSGEAGHPYGLLEPAGPWAVFRMSLVSKEKQTSSLIIVERAEKPNGK